MKETKQTRIVKRSDKEEETMTTIPKDLTREFDFLKGCYAQLVTEYLYCQKAMNNPTPGSISLREAAARIRELQEAHRKIIEMGTNPDLLNGPAREGMTDISYEVLHYPIEGAPTPLTRTVTKLNEIKFRAWDEENKAMVCSDHEIENGENDYFFSLGSDGPRCFIVGEDLIDGEPILKLIPIENIMQFTGLRDRNGREIYEGDIVKKYNEVNEDFGFITLTVWWNKSRACFDLERIGGGDYAYLYKTEEKLEVIGNIYENKGGIK